MRFHRFFLLLILLVSWTTLVQAQEVQHVEIGINGLHCSACTFSVEKALRKLPFVSVINMDLNERKGIVYLDNEQDINFRKLAKAVINAGFSVRSMEVLFKNELSPDQTCLFDQICVLDEKHLNSNRIQLVGKGFQSAKSTNAVYRSMECSCEDEDLIIAVSL